MNTRRVKGGPSKSVRIPAGERPPTGASTANNNTRLTSSAKGSRQGVQRHAPGAAGVAANDQLGRPPKEVAYPVPPPVAERMVQQDPTNISLRGINNLTLSQARFPHQYAHTPFMAESSSSTGRGRPHSCGKLKTKTAAGNFVTTLADSTTPSNFNVLEIPVTSMQANVDDLLTTPTRPFSGHRWRFLTAEALADSPATSMARRPRTGTANAMVVERLNTADAPSGVVPAEESTAVKARTPLASRGSQVPRPPSQGDRVHSPDPAGTVTKLLDNYQQHLIEEQSEPLLELPDYLVVALEQAGSIMTPEGELIGCLRQPSEGEEGAELGADGTMGQTTSTSRSMDGTAPRRLNDIIFHAAPWRSPPTITPNMGGTWGTSNRDGTATFGTSVDGDELPGPRKSIPSALDDGTFHDRALAPAIPTVSADDAARHFLWSGTYTSQGPVKEDGGEGVKTIFSDAPNSRPLTGTLGSTMMRTRLTETGGKTSAKVKGSVRQVDEVEARRWWSKAKIEKPMHRSASIEERIPPPYPSSMLIPLPTPTPATTDPASTAQAFKTPQDEADAHTRTLQVLFGREVVEDALERHPQLLRVVSGQHYTSTPATWAPSATPQSRREEREVRHIEHLVFHQANPLRVEKAALHQQQKQREANAATLLHRYNPIVESTGGADMPPEYQRLVAEAEEQTRGPVEDTLVRPTSKRSARRRSSYASRGSTGRPPSARGGVQPSSLRRAAQIQACEERSCHYYRQQMKHASAGQSLSAVVPSEAGVPQRPISASAKSWSSLSPGAEDASTTCGTRDSAMSKREAPPDVVEQEFGRLLNAAADRHNFVGQERTDLMELCDVFKMKEAQTVHIKKHPMNEVCISRHDEWWADNIASHRSNSSERKRRPPASASAPTKGGAKRGATAKSQTHRPTTSSSTSEKGTTSLADVGDTSPRRALVVPALTSIEPAWQRFDQCTDDDIQFRERLKCPPPSCTPASMKAAALMQPTHPNSVALLPSVAPSVASRRSIASSRPHPTMSLEDSEMDADTFIFCREVDLRLCKPVDQQPHLRALLEEHEAAVRMLDAMEKDELANAAWAAKEGEGMDV